MYVLYIVVTYCVDTTTLSYWFNEFVGVFYGIWCSFNFAALETMYEGVPFFGDVVLRLPDITKEVGHVNSSEPLAWVFQVPSVGASKGPPFLTSMSGLMPTKS